MERRDAWGIAFVGCFALGLVAASTAAALVRLPGGNFSMEGMWTIAITGAGTWSATTGLVALAWLRERRRGNAR